MFKNKDKQSIIYTNEEERHCVGTVMDHKPLPIGIDNFYYIKYYCIMRICYTILNNSQ